MINLHILPQEYLKSEQWWQVQIRSNKIKKVKHKIRRQCSTEVVLFLKRTVLHN